MAYQMKSSPAKLQGAIKLGQKLIKYGKSLFDKTKTTTVKKTEKSDFDLDKIRKSLKKQLKEPVRKGDPTRKL